MRTREEQARDMAVGIEGDDKPSERLICLMAKELKEAERRAEERVRAEIARDSDRLDWLDGGQSIVLQDDDGWRVTIGGIEFACMEETARDAIDAAREVG